MFPLLVVAGCVVVGVRGLFVDTATARASALAALGSGAAVVGAVCGRRWPAASRLALVMAVASVLASFMLLQRAG